MTTIALLATLVGHSLLSIPGSKILGNAYRLVTLRKLCCSETLPTGTAKVVEVI